MKLHLEKPLKEWFVTQKFGNSNPTLYGTMGHNGMDLRAKHGTPIYASHDGFASYQVDGGGGHGVVIISDKEYEGVDGVTSFWKSIYWHLVDPLKEPKYASPFADKTGFTPVKTGDLIGYADNTGKSTGSHLHFGLKPVAQGEYWGSWYNSNQNNGYYGAVNPEPYLDEIHTGIYFSKTMKFGNKGNEVRNLQRVLTQLGYLEDVVDGIYGKNTKTAVLAFQVANKVISSPLESLYGYHCGPKTLKALNTLT